MSPLHSRGTKLEVVPNKGEQNQKWLPHPCLLGGPKEGNNIRSGYLTLAFSGAKRGRKCYPPPIIQHKCY